MKYKFARHLVIAFSAGLFASHHDIEGFDDGVGFFAFHESELFDGAVGDDGDKFYLFFPLELLDIFLHLFFFPKLYFPNFSLRFLRPLCISPSIHAAKGSGGR